MGFEFVAEHPDGPFAGGVAFVYPWHPVGSIRVGDDGADFAAFGGALCGVDVAEWGASGGAAGFGFLGHAFLGFGGEVLAVELGDGAHDAV
ncbi:hypothetical protein V7R84_06990 [Arachnia propionica]